MTRHCSTDIDIAGDLIRDGELVAMPTETVYGLAADATNDRAIAKIYETKGRPQFNPLIAHVSDAEMAADFVHIPPTAINLIEAFWPGALTLVLERTASCAVSRLASAGLSTLAIRAPAHPIARALIANVGKPLAAPSANRSGSMSPTIPDHVAQSLGPRAPFILDGGSCEIGVESTIVRIDNNKLTLLRPGGIPLEALEEVANQKIELRTQTKTIEAPGMLESHYAPSVPLRTDVTDPSASEAFLAFGASVDHPNQRNLSPVGDLTEAAANLFTYLHELDALCKKQGLERIAAAPVPLSGLGRAINDRLTRAAATRP